MVRGDWRGSVAIVIASCGGPTAQPARPFDAAWCGSGAELVALHRRCPDAPHPIGTPGPSEPVCAFPQAIVCGIGIDDGPNGTIATCVANGMVRNFEVRSPEARIVGQCTNNIAVGDWRYFQGSRLSRIDRYENGKQVSSRVIPGP